MPAEDGAWFTGVRGEPWNPNMADRWCVWPTADRPFNGVVLGSTITALWVHWEGGRNVVCHGKRACERCAAGKTPKAQYHLNVWDASSKHRVTLVLGTRASAALAAAATEAGHLRGLAVKITKQSKGNRAAYDVAVTGDYHAHARLPMAGDLYADLCALYGVRELPMYTTEGVGS